MSMSTARDKDEQTDIGEMEMEEPWHDAAAHERRVSLGKMLALTCSAGGLQLIWSTIFSHGSAYLFSLGITPSQSSLIWAFAPICGTLIQPLVGIISDSCHLRYGKRRPFMLGGTLGVVVCIFALAWVEDMACSLGLASSRAGTLAIILIVLLNVSIQPLQSGIRALAVDVVDVQQQANATAWASRFIGVGNVVGYFAGSVPLPISMAKYETRRFRCMALLSCVLLSLTVAVTVLCVKEKDPRTDRCEGPKSADEEHPGFLTSLLNGIKNMPIKVMWVCKVQFFSWMAWFGFLFYSSSYVSSLYLSEERKRGVPAPLRFHSDSGAVGSSANLLFAVVALGTNLLLPFVVRDKAWGEKRSSKIRGEFRFLARLWAGSNVLHTICALATVFVTSSMGGIVLMGLVGMCWAVTQWVPFAIISAELSPRTSSTRFYSALESGRKESSRPTPNESGIMMGLHNAAISLPQILAALVASVIFQIAKDAGRNEEAVAWVLRTSAGATAVAAWLVIRDVR